MQEIMQFINNHSILILVWLVLLAIIIFISIQNQFFSIGEVSRGEAILLINKEDAVIVDLRSRDDYRKGHIANSVNMLPTDIKNGNLDALDKAKPVIVVFTSGTISRESAKKLNKAGFERVYVLKEGIFGWSEENLPLVQDK
ncbi:MAG: putative sulfurtransferase YibN [Sodalis sp. Fle]|nr:MAG: putative sulfurtransferase YibN [Sodalis sp. Fle]